MTLGLGAALLGAVVFGVASVAQAIGARRVPSAHPGIGVALAMLRQPIYQLSIVLTLAGFFLHLVAVRTLPLYLAQAGVSASVAVTALSAVAVLGAQLGKLDWAAVAAVCIGLGLLAVSAGTLGSATSAVSSGTGPALLAATSIIGLLAWGALRLPDVWAGAALGVLAGLAFSVTGIAARLLPSGSFADLVTSPEAAALIVAGPLGFFIASVALQRGAVTTVSAAIVVMQTAAPAFVGLWFLGDTIRGGWEAAALLGFLLAAGGSSELARYERMHGRQEDHGEQGAPGLTAPRTSDGEPATSPGSAGT